MVAQLAQFTAQLTQKIDCRISDSSYDSHFQWGLYVFYTVILLLIIFYFYLTKYHK